MDETTPIRLQFDGFDLDEANARLMRAGRPIALAPKAFAVLCELARRRDQLVTKNALLDSVWGHQHVSESLLKNVVSEIRAALSDDAKRPRYIETASRFGYRFIGSSDTPVIGTSTGALPVPLPIPGPASPAATIIGREASLAQMRVMWQKAQTGTSQLLCIAGEAGIGKTTLIDTFVSELGMRTAAYGRCIEHYGSGEPYLPVLEVLREICRVEPELAQMVRAIAPTWLIQMPWLMTEEDRASLHRELAGAHPDRMLREMRELMDRFSAARPFVFIMEDMHWSDLGTLRMMEIFARRPRPVPILWIATFRLTQIVAENHPLKELRQEMRLHRLCEEILLDPFSERDVGSYLQNRMPTVSFPEAFIRRVHTHTDGLPLFVATVADTLTAQLAADPSTQAQWLEAPEGTQLPVPDSLAGIIEKQIGRLPSDVQALLEAAAVCGMEFRAGTVADLIGKDPQWVRDRCDDLARRQIWLRAGDIVELPDGEFDTRYVFIHALYVHVFYERVATSQRVQHHRRAARSLDQNRAIDVPPMPAELASHYERGYEHLRAARAYAEAASLALAHFAPKDATHLSTRGLSLLNRCAENDERREVELALCSLCGVAASQMLGVAAPETRAAFQRVQQLCEQLPKTPARAATLNGLGLTFYVRGEFDAALALAMQLEKMSSGDDDLFLLAFNLAGLSLINQGKLLEGCDYLRRGIEKCQGASDARPDFIIDPEVSMRMNIAFPLVDLGLADEARRHFELGSERANRIRQPMGLMLTYWAGGILETRLQNPDAVSQHAANLGALVERAMVTQGLGPSLWLRGYAEAHLGDPEAGLAHILEGYQCHARFGMYAGCTEVLGYAVEALLTAGRYDEADRQIETAQALAHQIGERIATAKLYQLQAQAALARNDRAKARTLLMSALQEVRDQSALGHELKVRVALAELDRAPADMDALRGTYEKLVEGFDTKIYLKAKGLLEAEGKRN